MLAAIMLWCATIQAETFTAAANMDKAFEAFLTSGQLLTKDTHWSHAMEQWHFKLAAEGDSLSEPQALTRLKEAFAASIGEADMTYQCNKGNCEPWQLQYHRKDNFYYGIYGRYDMDSCYNVRLLTLNDTDGRAYYGMRWKIERFTDAEGKPWCTLDGMLFKFNKGEWTLKVQINDAETALRNYNATTQSDVSDQWKYESLRAQMRKLNELSMNGKGVKTDLYIYMLNKLTENYDGKLTQQQYDNMIKEMPVLDKRKMTPESKYMLARVMRRLEKAVRPVMMQTHTTVDTESGPFIDPDNVRMLKLDFDLGDAPAPQLTVNLSGTSVGRVTASSYAPDIFRCAALPKNGSFKLSFMATQNQPYTLCDRRGNRLTLFADTVPVQVDLVGMTVSGSPLNERMAEVQRRMKALEPEMLKYASRDADGDYTVMDTAGYRRLTERAHRLRMQLIAENSDNIIPVWLLTSDITSMSVSDLAPCLDSSLPYADHPMMQPIRQYYNGLLKRQPGRMFADAVCVDTSGDSHHLSEYIGHGDYVVLQFWEERDWTAHKGCKHMKSMAKRHKGKNIRFIGLSLDADKQRWKNYVRKRDLCYEHLSVPTQEEKERWAMEATTAYGIMSLPETIIFAPDGTIISGGLAADALEQFVEALPLLQQ